MTAPRLYFRADIEGMRALAILLVVIAHAGVPWLQGGFVGVDVFFVISGFLISSLLVEEYRRTGRIDFRDFYARRLRRLFPALLLVLLASTGAAMLLLAPMEQVGQASTGFFVPLWLSNFHFSGGDLDYFSPQAANDLFLHTWSLAVEEQFYLFWPAVLLVALALGRRLAPEGNARRALAATLVAAFAASLGFCLYQTATDQIAAFYLIPTRIWQFSLGALVAMAAQDELRAPASRPTLHWLAGRGAFWGGWFGLAAILASALVLDDRSTYPGANALLPTFGAAAILLSGRNSGPAGVGRLLATPLAGFIGRISYGWYLWHWPVLMIGVALFPNAGLAWTLLLAVVSLLAAWLSFHLVERPVRRSAWLARRPLLTLSATLALMLSASFGMTVWQAQARQWAGEGAQQRYLQVRNDTPEIYAAGCDDWYRSARLRPCVAGGTAASRTVVLIGDSVGMQWSSAFSAMFPAPEWRIVVLTKSSCPMVDRPYHYARIGRRFTECEQWRDAAIGHVAAIRPDVLIMGSAAGYPFTESEWVRGTTAVVERFSAATAQVLVVAPTPALSFDPVVCLARRDWQPKAISAYADCSEPLQRVRAANVTSWLRKATAGYDNVRVLELDDIVCPGGVCAGERDGSIVYRDHQHVAAAYVRRQATALALQVQELMSRPPDASP